jgi:hypothetical protein
MMGIYFGLSFGISGIPCAKIIPKNSSGTWAGFQTELIADVSADFINADTTNIDQKIDHMLWRCGTFLNVDRTFLFQFAQDDGYASNTHEWCAEGVASIKKSLLDYPLADVPVIARSIQDRTIFFVPDVALFPESPDKTKIKDRRVQSTLLYAPDKK